MEDVGNSGLDVIDGGCHGHGDFRWQPCHSVSDMLGLGGCSPHCVAVVRVKGGPKVPPIKPMGGPAMAHHRLVMDDDMDAGWGDRCLVEIKWSMQLHPGGEMQVDA